MHFVIAQRKSFFVANAVPPVPLRLQRPLSVSARSDGSGRRATPGARLRRLGIDRDDFAFGDVAFDRPSRTRISALRIRPNTSRAPVTFNVHRRDVLSAGSDDGRYSPIRSCPHRESACRVRGISSAARTMRAFRQFDFERVVLVTFGRSRVPLPPRRGIDFSLAFAPVNLFSAFVARHGLCATPPSAMRARRDCSIRTEIESRRPR